MKIGIVCGIHEDIENLEKAIVGIEERECDTIVCLGDMVGFTEPYYGHEDTRDVNAVITLVKEKCQYVVIGNHDIVPARVTPKQTPFVYPQNWYDLSFDERKECSKEKVWVCEDDLPVDLSEESVNYLRSLPEYQVIETAEMNILISHYAFPNLIGDDVESDPIVDNGKAHLDFIRKHDCQLGIFNHDLQSGVRFFTGDSASERGFGMHNLPSLSLAMNGVWVANGTESNGFMILDTAKNTVEVISLGSTPYTVRSSQ